MNVSAPGLRGTRLCDPGSPAISSRVFGRESFWNLGLWRDILTLQGWKRYIDFQQDAIWTSKSAQHPAPPIINPTP